MIILIKSTGQFYNLPVAINDEKTNSQLPQSIAKLINRKLGCS